MSRNGLHGLYGGVSSYLVQNSDKPIATGSQQPIQMEITDAKKNLYDSIVYAADGSLRALS